MQHQPPIDIARQTPPAEAQKRQTLAPDEEREQRRQLATKAGVAARIGRYFQAYGAALIAGFAIVPIIAAIITVGFYLTTASWYAPAWGTAVTCIGWLLICIPLASLTSAQAVNPHSYGLLENQLSRLKSRLNMLQNTIPEEKLRPYQRVALEEAYDNLTRLQHLVYSSTDRLPWVLAMAYINAWNWLHRAEEALIEIEPIEMVVRGAYHDYMAITDSKMNNAQDLLRKLRTAAKTLDPGIAVVFLASSTSEEVEQLQNVAQSIEKVEYDVQRIATHLGLPLGPREDQHDPKAWPAPQPATSAVPTAAALYKEANARVTLREIRRALNEFRDNQWLGIINARNHLIAAIFVTGLVTFALLSIAILSLPLVSGSLQAIRAPLLAAVVFYIVGAIGGLFGTIYRETTANSAEDDYGLTLARLTGTPLISGLAGIGGVFIYSTIVLQLASSASITLSATFALDRLDFLIAAALFGYAPNLLIKGLQFNKYVSALQSSKLSITTDTSDRQDGTN